MSDVHVRQLLGSPPCGPRNCAAASGAMAVAFAGGPVLTAQQFRELSGISCTLGVDTASGGLRAFDVYSVAKSLGVDINYGGLQGGLVDWPSWALEQRLREGEGCIVLGDCKVAPTSPCATDELYHSAFVHDFRLYNGVEQTHWHDPRLPGPSWQAISRVIAYWQGMEHGRRFAGFVAQGQVTAPPDTSTGEPDMNRPFDITSYRNGVLVTGSNTWYMDPFTRQRSKLPANVRKQFACTTKWRDNGVGGFLIGEGAAIVDDDGTFTYEFETTPPTGAVRLTPGFYEV